LFTAGAVSVRIDADDDAFIRHPSLLEIVTTLQTEAGMLALVVSPNGGGTLVARVEEKQIVFNAEDAGTAVDTDEADGARRASKVVAAVHQLLHDAGVFISPEMAGL
jgi:hypothetical protein